VQLLKLGYSVVVEAGAGQRSDFPDDAFVDAGASIGDAWQADIVFGINSPSEAELERMRPGSTLVALLAPALAARTSSSGSGSGRSRRCRWTRCPGSPGPSRSTCSARWRTSPATGP